jgi:hypothetical protein
MGDKNNCVNGRKREGKRSRAPTLSAIPSFITPSKSIPVDASSTWLNSMNANPLSLFTCAEIAGDDPGWHFPASVKALLKNCTKS